jgi:formate C-acetyltransferase
MPFIYQRESFERELDSHYETYPVDLDRLHRRMSAISAEHPEWSSFRRKALIYQTAAESCEVKVFRHCPLYFELISGRVRHRWGFDGLGAWLKQEPEGQTFFEQCKAWKDPWSFVSFNGQDVDLDHHTIGYDNVLQQGLEGILHRAKERLTDADDTEKREFLQAAVIGLESLIAISQKFALEAERMLAEEADPSIAENLQRVAQTARRVPARRPETFYEALNTILFVREILCSIEGIGVSTYGHLDRMLGPYYQADLQVGRITRQEAKDLLKAFLSMTDVKFAERREHRETSTTVFIGGCDAEGNAVCNDVTRMIVEVYDELALVNPKFQARISASHPKEYFQLLSGFLSRGHNVMAVYNDDIVVPANVRSGKAQADARLYVGGGCQENILQNCEISSRATLFFNALAVLEMGLHRQRWADFLEAERLALADLCEAENFESFYRAYLENLKTVVERLIDRRNRFESEGPSFNPCPLLSSTLDDCIADGRDMTAGGCRYSTGSVDMIGIGTLVDSLWAVREMVYRRGEITLEELRRALAEDFAGAEHLAARLRRELEKFGRSRDPEFRQFTARVFADVARATSGKPNTRGGRYVASLFAHRGNVGHGQKSLATPDGRRQGRILSKGMGPSNEALGSKAAIGDILDALEPLDMTDYPVVAILDMKLPSAEAKKSAMLVESILHRFLAVGGSVLQINVVDPKILMEAREQPELHPDLVVRVSGYSAYFSNLPQHVRDEIIERTLLEAGA